MNDRTLRVLEYPKIIQMLATHAKSPLGREKVLSLKPVSDSEAVWQMLEETSEAESITAIEGTGFVSFFPDVHMHLRKAKIGSILSPKELLQIGQVLTASHRVKERMNAHKTKSTLRIIPDLIRDIRVLKDLGEEISRCIEGEESISDHASPELNHIRRQIVRSHERIRERLNSIIHSSQYLKMLQDPIVTIRNDRYVVPVKQEHRSNFPGIVHDQSSSGATLFIEPMTVVEANNELRRMMLAEEQEIERILAELTAQVEAVGEEVAMTLDILVKLDFIFAKGGFSLAIKGVCPKPASGQSIKIVNGRHPLIPRNEVVPISLELGKSFNALVITGPNTGGKTVTLKTTGLFVLMAQSGLHVPADYGTEMGVFGSVYADIGDEQSIEQSLSTFSSHMTNIVQITKEVVDGDLVLFDELGAGTDPTEGAALAMSILDYLHHRKILTMATTHYSELKLYAITGEGVENASVEFDIETLRPTYRLMTGIPGKSNAFEISRRLGLMEELIVGAKEYLSQEDIRFEDIMGNIERNRIVAEQERQEANKALTQIDELRKQLLREQDAFDKQKNALMVKAKEEARRVLRGAKDEADAIIKELQLLARETEEKERYKAIEEARRKLKNTLNGLGEGLTLATSPSNSLLKPPKNLRLGETVYITNLDQKGQVLNLPDGDGEVMVQIGIMKVNVHISNLRLVDQVPSEGVRTNKKVTPRTSTVSSELDLRGQNAEEAILSADRYLDDAFLAGLSEITIIHGKGTGILRSTIHQQLKQHPHVATFRIGKYGEGESGVTLVQLK